MILPARPKKQSGFTLIEILIVIALIGIIGTAFLSNFFSSIARGRDSRRKQDLRSIAQALELYYSDNQSYPDSLPAVGVKFTHPDNPDTLYLQETPGDPQTDKIYCYESDGSWYRLTANLENTSDPDVLTTAVWCGGIDYNYGIASPNITL
ncbi:hypothetical protein A3D78_02820 [Candidatus Gottesmanbacteria bacterium RIFCSPHIGHO2_02_FULL_39_14]|uniref:Type II secretion system protein GspG C-terminal domain-containing protein n=1 Tax=Candidatus Gottesmanbacteria bacterium RIFCSPHIGHO2_02_FULL_39_14 TaxID=1798383 RepID=A0A1F5ZZF5_9BACT|nr:MAG: hypothetical protein A3D78_02820 [Candidatus Gottesmanbacteria bacterium RIFCSPHIGHO2_02_FULL_39_14]